MNKEILKITKKFHDTYEKLASEYTYETREDTKVFDINSSNGKLMYATVNEIVSPILKENQELKKQLEKKYSKTGNLTNEILYEENTKLINQQKEFIEYLEKEIVDSRAGSGQQYYAQEHLKMFEEIIGGKE